MKRTLFIIALALLTVLRCQAAAAPYEQDSQYPYIVITDDGVDGVPTFADEEFYVMSTGVVFEVNKTAIRPDDAFFTLYQNEILPRVNQQHLQLRKVFVRGAASPEGSYNNNRRLGRARSQALLDALCSQLRNQYIEMDAEVSSVTEDYGRLCYMMQQAADPDYQTVRDIYDRCEGNEPRIKQQLMAAQGGRLWKRLLKEYFPSLRSARLILWFSRPDREHAPLSEIAQLRPDTVQILPLPWPDNRDVRPILPPQAPVGYTRRHLLAFRTNLLHDFFYMPQFGLAMSPNYQLEYYPLDGHYTYNAALTWGTHRHWDTQQFFQVRDVQLELRRYFRGHGDFTGLYLDAYVHGNKYGIGLSPTKGWQGEGGGAGLGIGYVRPLNKRGNLRLEVMAAVGYYRTLYDPYVYGNPITGQIDGDYYYDYYGTATDFKRRNHAFSWFGPTNVGLSLTYDILYRKKKPTTQIAR